MFHSIEEIQSAMEGAKYSPQEILMAKDFGEFSREDTEILEREFSRLLAGQHPQGFKGRGGNPRDPVG